MALTSCGTQTNGQGRVKLMLEHIRQNYAGPLTLAGIAGAAVSESECLRCFRRIIGLPPFRYVTQYRTQRAAQRLQAQTPDQGAPSSERRSSAFSGVPPSSLISRQHFFFCESAQKHLDNS